jgi:U3 small nucleolar RNA-associated protein 5
MNQFSLLSKYYLHISNDNRIHIYNTATSKLLHSYIEKNHLTHSYLCSAWGQTNPNDLGLYGIGTSDGLILIWDFTRGVVSQTIGIKNETSIINNILFTNNLKSILVTYPSSSQINEYSVETGDLIRTFKGFKKGTSKIIKNPTSASAFVAARYYPSLLLLSDSIIPDYLHSHSMKFFDQDKSAKFKISSSFPGDGPTAMAWTPCGKYLFCTSSGSHNSDDLIIYNLSSEVIATNPDDIEPIYSHSITGKVRSMEIMQSSPENYQLAILFQDQKGCLLSLPMTQILSGDTATTQLQQVELHCDVNGAISPLDNILALTFPPSGSSQEHAIVMAIGKVSLPQFIKYSYPSSATSTSSSLVIPLSVNEKKSKKSETDSAVGSKGLDSSFEVSHVGPHESGGVKRPLVALEVEEEGDGDEEDEDEEGDEETAAATDGKKKRQKRSLMDGGVDVGGSLTLEERLRNITTTLTKLEQDPEHFVKQQQSSSSSGKKGVGGGLSSSVTSDSLVVLIEQALQSLDDALLEQCVSQSSEDIIRETIQRLPSNRIIQLLKKLIQKFEKKSSRGLVLMKWISMILRYHTSFLLSIHDLSSQLIGLNAILEQRLSTYVKLSSLAGRLDLMMAHITSPTNTTSNGHHTATAAESEKNGKFSAAGAVGGKSQRKKSQQPKQVLYEE